MATTIQIGNVPDALHRRLKARAELEGVPMSLYVLQEIERALARPTRRELLETIRAQAKVELDLSPAVAVRRERDAKSQ